ARTFKRWLGYTELLDRPDRHFPSSEWSSSDAMPCYTYFVSMHEMCVDRLVEIAAGGLGLGAIEELLYESGAHRDNRTSRIESGDGTSHTRSPRYRNRTPSGKKQSAARTRSEAGRCHKSIQPRVFTGKA